MHNRHIILEPQVETVADAEDDAAFPFNNDVLHGLQTDSVLFGFIIPDEGKAVNEFRLCYGCGSINKDGKDENYEILHNSGLLIHSTYSLSPMYRSWLTQSENDGFDLLK